MANITLIEKPLVLLQELTFGLSTTTGASRTLQVSGNAADIDLNILTVGNGVIKTRAGYAADVAADIDIVNYEFVRTHLGTKLLSSSLQAPTITEDGQYVKWDNTANTFVLSTVGSGLTFNSGLTNTSNTVRWKGTLLEHAEIIGAFDVNLGTVADKIVNFRVDATTLVDIRGIGTSQLLFNGTNSATLLGGSVSSYFIINDDGALIIRDNIASPRGLRGYADYSANITANDYTQKAYTDAKIVGKNISSLLQTPTVAEHGYVISWDNTNSRFNLTESVAGDTLIKEQTFTADGSTSVFVVTTGTVEKLINVFVNGIFQTEGLHFTLTGQNIDFGANLLIGASVTVIYAEELLAGSDSTFSADVTFVLSGSKSFGKYTNGQTAAWTGLTAVEAITDAAIEYINPAFTSFSISGQATTVEVGTTLSGSKTFIWNVDNNSGIVTTIDIYNNTTAATLLAATPDDGTQAVTITTVQLNSNGATQSWKGIANNTSPAGTVNSSNFVVTSRFYIFYSPSATSPTDSATVRALASSAFYTGSGSFTLNTGTTLTKFVVALPPSVTITSVIDTTALNANITTDYILIGTINVLDAGGTNRSYNIYEMNIGAPYAVSHAHVITIS